MRGDGSNIDGLVRLNAEQLQCLALGSASRKRDACEAQEADGVGRIAETGNEGGLYKIEVRLGSRRQLRAGGHRVVRRLPLGCASAHGVVARPMVMVVVMRMIVIMVM